jgi:thiol-disulfide isomerase/thioredoxin
MKFSIQPHERASNFWTPLRAALTLITLALLSTFGVSSCGKPAETTENAPKVTVNVNNPNAGPRVNKSAPAPTGPSVLPDIALNTELKGIMDGKTFKLSDLKGKVLVVDLWATWCVPCRNSTPELVNLQKEFGPKGFEVIGLDIDPEDDTPEKVRDFADEFDINYKLAFAERELAVSLMRGGNIPQSLVVGRDGRIVEHLVGYSQSLTPKRLRAAIEKALE